MELCYDYMELMERRQTGKKGEIIHDDARLDACKIHNMYTVYVYVDAISMELSMVDSVDMSDLIKMTLLPAFLS